MGVGASWIGEEARDATARASSQKTDEELRRMERERQRGERHGLKKHLMFSLYRTPRTDFTVTCVSDGK